MTTQELKRIADEAHRLYGRSLKSNATTTLTSAFLAAVHALCAFTEERGYQLHLSQGGVSWTKMQAAKLLTIEGALS